MIAVKNPELTQFHIEVEPGHFARENRYARLAKKFEREQARSPFNECVRSLESACGMRISDVFAD